MTIVYTIALPLLSYRLNTPVCPSSLWGSWVLIVFTCMVYLGNYCICREDYVEFLVELSLKILIVTYELLYLWLHHHTVSVNIVWYRKPFILIPMKSLSKNIWSPVKTIVGSFTMKPFIYIMDPSPFRWKRN